MNFLINRILLFVLLIELNECRRTLRDYMIRENGSSPNPMKLRDELIISDQREKEVLCRLESFWYGRLRITNLYPYRSTQLIGLIENLWSPLCRKSFI